MQGALAEFQEAIETQNDYPEAWNNAGMILQQMGLHRQAESHFNQAMELRTDYADALNNRGRLRHLQGNVAGATEDFDHALAFARGPIAATLLHNLGSLRQAQNDIASALTAFDKSLEIAPGRVVTLRARAFARKAAGDFTGALIDLDHALLLVARDSATEVLHERGGVKLLLNDWEGAIADYDNAIAIDPNCWLAWVSRGHARYHQRDFGGVADYRRALSINAPGTIREVARFALQDSARDPTGVLRNCAKHLRINDQDAIAHARRCLTLAALGRPADAAEELEIFRELAPDLAGVLYRILKEMESKGPARD